MAAQATTCWRPPPVAPSFSESRPPRPSWPIHDLIVSSFLVWLRPTHMLTHFVRFVVVLAILWMICLLLLLQLEMSVFDRASFADAWKIQRTSDLPCILLCVITLALSVEWCRWYMQKVFFAMGKPWMNPGKPSIHRMEMHVPLRLFDNVDKARRAACIPHMVAYNATPPIKDQKEFGPLTPNVLQLDTYAEWKFQLLFSVEEGLALVEQDWAAHQNDQWSPIQIPGNWMLQGFPDIPIYTNKKYPFTNLPPVVPRRNPTGVYRLDVELPRGWDGSQKNDDTYSIILNGVESACYAYWDGTLLGFFKDSRLPSEFAIPSEAWRKAAPVHTLHLVVARWSDGSYMEDQDHWWMAGVHRSVELVRRPAGAHVLDYRVHASASREIHAAVRVQTTSISQGFQLTAILYEDEQLSPLGEDWRPATQCLWSQTKSVEPGRLETDTLIFQSSSLNDVKLWTAETPNLYTMVIVQEDKTTGKVRQVESCRVGFRSVEIRRDGILRINGERITVCGINRHEHDPDTGKVVSMERMMQDIVVLKQNNFNSIRTSHYPTHSSFYRLCDYYGMYVCDEANVETDGMKPMGRLANDWGWERAFITRVNRMVRRDWNHPCIIWWSLGNESGRGRNLFQARKRILELDTSRPVCYEGGGSWTEGIGTTELTDVVCPMYPNIPSVKALSNDAGDGRPIILCEYSHSMNNSNGNLHFYWEIFWNPKFPRCQGGFIWDMIDQGLRKCDDSGREYFAYGGDFGDEINDKQFCINGMFSPEREPHPCVSEIKYLQQPVAFSLPESLACLDLKIAKSNRNLSASVLVSNRYSFRDLTHLRWRWSLVIEELPRVMLNGEASLVESCLNFDLSEALIHLCGSEKRAYLNVEATLSVGEVWASAGHQIASEQFPVHLAFEGGNELASKSVGTRDGTDTTLSISETSSEVKVSKGAEGDFAVVVDKKTGGIRSILSEGQHFLIGTGLQPSFTRATTDNDRGGMELVLDFLRLNWTKSLLQTVNKSLFSYEMHWRDHGLSQGVPPFCECTDVEIDNCSGFYEVRITTTCRIKDRTGLEIIRQKHTYTIFHDKRVLVEVHFVPSTHMKSIPSLPRVGLSATLDPSLYRIQYFGRGPEENYSDRKSSAKMGLWSSTPSKMGYNYIVPSENGNRCDCRWMSFESAKNECFVIAPISMNGHLCLSASLHSAQELHDAWHTNELEPRNDGTHSIRVNIDHALMGLGGDVSWFPCVYEEFLVESREYKYSTWFIIPNKDEQPESAVQRAIKSILDNK